MLLALLFSPQLSMHLSSTLLAQLPVTVCVCVCVAVSSNCALHVESRVRQDAAGAGMLLQAFSAIRCHCQDALMGVYTNKLWHTKWDCNTRGHLCTLLSQHSALPFHLSLSPSCIKTWDRRRGDSGVQCDKDHQDSIIVFHQIIPTQRWEVVEYKYFVTVLKYLYLTTFYFDFLHF